MTISPLESIFKGKKELFKGLRIYNKDYDWKEYPVFHIDLGQINATDAEMLKKSLKKVVENLSIEYAVEFDKDAEYYNAWSELIKNVAQNSKVVILIDEYDKILSSNIGNPDAEEIRRILAGLFETLKASCEYLKFVFVTGVTGFTNITSFSTANNFYDITTDERYSSLFGYTEDDVQHYFSEHIEKGIQETGMTRDEYMSKLSLTYGGYRFSPSQKKTLFNPSSLGFFFADGGSSFNNYWVETGLSMLLMKMMKRTDVKVMTDVVKRMSNECMRSSDILGFGAENVYSSSYRALLYQSGYLTIIRKCETNPNACIVDFPNIEVANTYFALISKSCSDDKPEETFKESWLYEYMLRHIRALYS